METLNSLIEKRYSPLAFSAKQVENEKLQLLFEAAGRAPSSMNEQPWMFVYATKENETEYKNMLDSIVESNKVWAHNAPVLVLVAAKKTFARNDKPNRHYMYDAGQAVGNLLTQATQMGLYAHQMGGFSVDTAIQNLALPENLEPIAMISIGYLGENSELPESLRTRANTRSTRKPLSEFVFKGKMMKAVINTI